jgi:hypothetical protein
MCKASVFPLQVSAIFAAFLRYPAGSLNSQILPLLDFRADWWPWFVCNSFSAFCSRHAFAERLTILRAVEQSILTFCLEPVSRNTVLSTRDSVSDCVAFSVCGLLEIWFATDSIQRRLFFTSISITGIAIMEVANFLCQRCGVPIRMNPEFSSISELTVAELSCERWSSFLFPHFLNSVLSFFSS